MSEYRPQTYRSRRNLVLKFLALIVVILFAVAPVLISRFVLNLNLDLRQQASGRRGRCPDNQVEINGACQWASKPQANCQPGEHDVLDYMLPDPDKLNLAKFATYKEENGQTITRGLDAHLYDVAPDWSTGNVFFVKHPGSYEWYRWDKENIYFAFNQEGVLNGRWYRHDPGVWLKRCMKVGDSVDGTLSNNKFVSYKKGCTEVDRNAAFPYTHKIVNHLDSYNAGGDLGVINNVLVMRNFRTAVSDKHEDFYFSKEYGWFQHNLIDVSQDNREVERKRLANQLGKAHAKHYPFVTDCQYIPQFVASQFTGQDVLNQLKIDPQKTNAQIKVRFRNAGIRDWKPNEYFLVPASGEVGQTWNVGKVKLSRTTRPGEVAEFTVNLTVPTTPGRYKYQFQIAGDQTGQFGELSNPVTVQVEP